ncbi:hypothetical protein CKF94_25135 [Vibrio coralliilyticus]|uniref:hypothetical protein n=1 Tax=Vibrio coralliilyticus TaxID=190893 RepID=UPI000BAB15DC|nr:hypothetical protein [Vibrio coralliilyticus]PAU35475.1 hypothetical protein CKF94_25135 [Vibrio coralliilyticus]
MKLLGTVKKYSLAAGTFFVSASAFANENPITKSINDAIAAGQSNYTLVVVGMITLAALAFGLTRITGGMK